MASNYPLRINSLSFHLSSLFKVFCSGEQIEKNGTKFVPFFPAQFSSSRRLHDLKAWNKLLIYPCLTFNFFWWFPTQARELIYLKRKKTSNSLFSTKSLRAIHWPLRILFQAIGEA